MDTPPDNLRRYTPISVDGDALEPEETPVDNAQPEEFGAEPAAAAPPPETPFEVLAPPLEQAPAADEPPAAAGPSAEVPLAPLPVPPPPLSPIEPVPVPVVSAPPKPAKRRQVAAAALGGLALPVGVPLLVAAIGALSIVAWLRHEPKISESEPRVPQPMAAPQGEPGMGQPPLGSPDMGLPGMPGPDTGASGMGAPGMGEPGMGAPGMGGPGIGGPGGPDGGMPSPDGMPAGGPPGMGSEPPPGFSGGPGMGVPSSDSLPGPGSMGGGPGQGSGGGRMFVPPATPGGGGGRGGFRGGPGGGRGSGAPPGNAVSGVVGGIKGTWPTYRGPSYNAVSAETTALAKSWGQGGPRKLWQVKLGEGYAGPAVLNGRVYVLDYDQSARADKLRCFELATGRELWSQSYPVDVKRNHGMSRTVPAVTTQFAVTLGPKCHVMCCDAVRGTVKWRMDLVRDWGTKVPTWYAGQCPLIDGSRVILAPGGKALMVAVDLATGKVAWKTPNPNGWQMTHSSIVPTTIGGVRMYVYPFSGGVAGIDAKTGKLLWSTTQWTVSTANIPMPIPVGDGRIFLSGGYNAGAMMLKVSKQGAGFTASPAYKLPASTFGSDQQTPILYKGNIYGVIPSGELACIDLNGKPLWRSGSTNRFGIGAYMIAGGMIYVVDDDGKLTLAEASPAGYKPLATAKVLNGPDAWGPMAMVSGRLLLRDLTTMVCLDVRKS